MMLLAFAANCPHKTLPTNTFLSRSFSFYKGGICDRSLVAFRTILGGVNGVVSSWHDLNMLILAHSKQQYSIWHQGCWRIFCVPAISTLSHEFRFKIGGLHPIILHQKITLQCFVSCSFLFCSPFFNLLSRHFFEIQCILWWYFTKQPFWLVASLSFSRYCNATSKRGSSWVSWYMYEWMYIYIYTFDHICIRMFSQVCDSLYIHSFWKVSIYIIVCIVLYSIHFSNQTSPIWIEANENRMRQFWKGETEI